MERDAAISQIEETCKTISLAMMKITPAVRFLNDADTQADVLRASHRLTVELETIKKQLIRLRGRDDSTDL
jgi:hypothetical protein